MMAQDSNAEAPDIELRRVYKQFGAYTAVNDVSVTIRRGEFFSLLGPSGCGKTTTLRIIAGFERPTGGDVLIRGRVANDVPPYRRETNLVFQQLALFPHLNVQDNIAYGLRVKGMANVEVHKRVKQVLDLVDLPGFEARQVRGLSGGQQQRVAIARALVNEPAVLLLDEPLGALDLKLRTQMQLELKALQHRLGTTFVYVTHDQGEALAMSDRIAVMNRGRVEQIGSSDEIYSYPKTAFVATFIGETNLLEVEVVESASGRHLVRVGPMTFTLISPGALPSKALISLRPERIRMGAAAEACDATFSGRVRETVHGGSIVRYQVAIADTVLSVQSQNDGARPYLVGEEVRVGWRVADAVRVGPRANEQEAQAGAQGAKT